jgi:hypothetical protein
MDYGLVSLVLIALLAACACAAIFRDVLRHRAEYSQGITEVNTAKEDNKATRTVYEQIKLLTEKMQDEQSKLRRDIAGFAGLLEAMDAKVASAKGQAAALKRDFDRAMKEAEEPSPEEGEPGEAAPPTVAPAGPDNRAAQTQQQNTVRGQFGTRVIYGG